MIDIVEGNARIETRQQKERGRS